MISIIVEAINHACAGDARFVKVRLPFRVFSHVLSWGCVNGPAAREKENDQEGEPTHQTWLKQAAFRCKCSVCGILKIPDPPTRGLIAPSWWQQIEKP
jgi:hypothetical protein